MNLYFFSVLFLEKSMINSEPGIYSCAKLCNRFEINQLKGSVVFTLEKFEISKLVTIGHDHLKPLFQNNKY